MINLRHNVTVYIQPGADAFKITPEQFADIGNYTLANGDPAVNVVCMFAANYSSNTRPYLRAYNNTPPTDKPFDPYMQTILESGSVKKLQDKGIKVLMTILNGYSKVGWSQFTSERDAQNFANYLQSDVIEKYGLDGIDIDDEYSNGQPTNTSLIMVSSIIKRLMPDKVLTKALFNDESYFQSNWNGITLADSLTAGWYMGYGSSSRENLPLYFSNGMQRDAVSMGYWAYEPNPDPKADVEWIESNGYGGVMVLGFEDPKNIALAGQLVNYIYGPGNWNHS